MRTVVAIGISIVAIGLLSSACSGEIWPLATHGSVELADFTQIGPLPPGVEPTMAQQLASFSRDFHAVAGLLRDAVKECNEALAVVQQLNPYDPVRPKRIEETTDKLNGNLEIILGKVDSLETPGPAMELRAKYRTTVERLYEQQRNIILAVDAQDRKALQGAIQQAAYIWEDMVEIGTQIEALPAKHDPNSINLVTTENLSGFLP